MDQQITAPGMAGEAFDPFASTLNAVELRLLQTLYRPALIARVTAEFTHLRNLGLVFVDPNTGYAELTPLGKAWLRSQASAEMYG